jgi:hypothetical protein
MQDKLGLAGTLESASEGNVEREELKGLWHPSKREFQRLLKYFSPLAIAWASVEVQQTLGSRRMKKQIQSFQPCFGGRCWNTAGIALWIGELFNHSKVNSLPGSILQLPCCTIYELFFSEGVDLTAPKLIAHFAAYRRPQMYSSMFKFLPSFPVYCIERTIKCGLTCICT